MQAPCSRWAWLVQCQVRALRRTWFVTAKWSPFCRHRSHCRSKDEELDAGPLLQQRCRACAATLCRRAGICTSSAACQKCPARVSCRCRAPSSSRKPLHYPHVGLMLSWLAKHFCNVPVHHIIRHSLCRLTAYTLQRLPELLLLPEPVPDDVAELLFAEPLGTALSRGLTEALMVAAEAPGSAGGGGLLQKPGLGLKGHSGGGSEQRSKDRQQRTGGTKLFPGRGQQCDPPTAEAGAARQEPPSSAAELVSCLLALAAAHIQVGRSLTVADTSRTGSQ